MALSKKKSITPGLRSSLDASGSEGLGFSSDEVEEGATLLDRTREEPGAEGPSHSTGKLLKGFYLYSVASEVFSVVSLSLFLPVCLEQMSRENGFLPPDYLTPCPPSSQAPPEDGEEQIRCAVRLLGAWIDTASFSLFTYSASVAVQALCVISMGALADDPTTRHRLMTLFASLGSCFTMSFLLLPPSSPIWPVAALLALVANVSFGASIVCLNSYLPELGRSESGTVSKLGHLEEVMETLKSIRATPTSTSDELLMANQAVAKAQDDYIFQKSLATSQISSRGVAAGYVSGIIALIVLLIPVTLMKGSTWALRCAIAGSGLCWAIGSIPALFWLRPSHTAQAMDGAHYGRPRSSTASLAESWRGLGRMLREWRKLPQTFVFLGAWFLLSDSFATITSTAMLFGKTSLGMSTSNLVIIAVISPAAGIAGAVFFPQLQKSALRWSNLHFLILLVLLASLVPIWGLAGLRRQWEMYLLAIVFGAIYGSFQSYARTCFSELVPSSQAARWFGLYSITDKSSSFLGPLLVAVVTNITSQIRHGFFLILLMFLLALPLLLKVDMDKGRNDAECYQRELMEAFTPEDYEEDYVQSDDR
ncbi:MFS general substrate transporter [Meredithblackwellia eburnea MCA 4105]